jgi:hypothetical protein
MRAIDAQVACYLVDFVFDKIERTDLDENVSKLRRIGPDFKAVSGMWPPSVKGKRKSH